jgi:hypothetical protein
LQLLGALPRAHGFGDLDADADDAARRTVRLDQRVVDEAEVVGLRRPVVVAIERRGQLGRHERFSGVEDLLQYSKQLAVHLRQDVPKPAAERIAARRDELEVTRIGDLEHQVPRHGTASDGDGHRRLLEHFRQPTALQVELAQQALALRRGLAARLHVGVRPEPPDDAALLVAKRLDARQEPPECAAPAAERELHLERPTGRDRRAPPVEHARELRRIVD